MSASLLKKCLALEENIHTENANIKSKTGKKRKSKDKNDCRTLTDEVKKSRKVDHTEENIKLLTEFNYTATTAKNIIQNHQGRLLKNQPKIKRVKKKPSAEPTVFTEEDFIKFEQEYFVKATV